VSTEGARLPATSWGVERESVADGVVALTVRGELDVATAPALREYSADQCSRDDVRVLIVDLDSVEFAGAAALGALVQIRQVAERRGAELRLVVTSRVMLRPLRLTGMEGEFAVYPSREQALPAAE
jgi:anti-anti-sigma factor